MCEFTASQYSWSYTETMQTPVWHLWQMWRAAIVAAEKAKKNRRR